VYAVFAAESLVRNLALVLSGTIPDPTSVFADAFVDKVIDPEVFPILIIDHSKP
jgi:hypothetical protein